MLTLFTVPKPFCGHIDVIQRNAIGSWKRLEPACTLVLCGGEEGTEQVARLNGAIHVPDVKRNELGTPLLDSVFAESCRVARTRLVCYCNADIVLLPAFMEAVRKIPFENFLMIGQRTTLEQLQLIDFNAPGWAETLSERARREGKLDGATAIDYMVFAKDGPLKELPPFAVGRPGWDNWFVERARTLDVPVINATRLVRVVHQKHDYSHVKHARGVKWEGPEAVHNRRLVGWPAHGRSNAYSVRDATHVLTAHGLQRTVNWRRHFPLHLWATYPLRLARRWVRKLKIMRRMSRRPWRLLSFCRYTVQLKARIYWRRLQGTFLRRPSV